MRVLLFVVVVNVCVCVGGGGQIRERELLVFFRNNHFSTMFKFSGLVYLLVTDVGFRDQPSIVWERLMEVCLHVCVRVCGCAGVRVRGLVWSGCMLKRGSPSSVCAGTLGMDARPCACAPSGRAD